MNLNMFVVYGCAFFNPIPDDLHNVIFQMDNKLTQLGTSVMIEWPHTKSLDFDHLSLHSFNNIRKKKKKHSGDSMELK